VSFCPFRSTLGDGHQPRHEDFLAADQHPKIETTSRAKIAIQTRSLNYRRAPSDPLSLRDERLLSLRDARLR
jgi:hypothetical protein